MAAARLLRDQPHVRRHFHERFTHILVDEFQDTDPIQAEVMLLLTATDAHERNWRRCIPRPGSLFVVGDPKQSIYRFRRADIVTYNDVRAIIARGERPGKEGRIVRLSANFRSTEPIVNWVNGGFAGTFPAEATDESPCYVALERARIDGNEGELAGVRVLRIPEKYSRNRAAAVTYEASRIARTIRHALDRPQKIARRAQEPAWAGKTSPEATPGDFLIITRTRANLSTYARALQEYGVPHQVTGGSALNEVPEVKLLHICLSALVSPEDPVALVAALRSELFGMSDAALYAFRKAGGEFFFYGQVPPGLPAEWAIAFRETFECLRKYTTWLRRLPAVAAIEKITTDLGLMVRAATEPGGDVTAGSLAKALEVLRNVQDEMWTTRQLVDYLGQLLALEERYDGVSVLSEDRPRVRVMNLHKAKGLEAPVVFLADPTGEADHDVDLFVDRSGDRVMGYMAVYREEGRWMRRLLAHPPGWAELAEREKKFLEAEELRLRYVAATRAGSMLVVTQRSTGNQRNPWHLFADTLVDRAELPDPGMQTAPPRPEIELSVDSVEDALQTVEDSLSAARRPTYAVYAAKEFALSGKIPSPGAFPRNASAKENVPETGTPEEGFPDKGPSGEDRREFMEGAVDSGEHGTEWGSVIHLLLQTAMKNPRADLAETAKTELAEHDLDPSRAPIAVTTVRSVMESAIWQRAQRSERCLTEVPFQVLLANMPENGEREAEQKSGPPTEEAGPAIPTLLRGAIDLLFREARGWVLVDYKTDRLTGTGRAALVDKYAPQVRLYARAWEACTGEPVAEKGLYFVRTGEYVSL
jgi:ATP-dependent helicase/nuclease subunit A